MVEGDEHLYNMSVIFVFAAAGVCAWKLFGG